MQTISRVLRPLPALSAIVALASQGHADFTATGHCNYQDRVHNWVYPIPVYPNCVPCWQPTYVNLPIRYATVKIINRVTGTVLAQTYTDSQGAFSVLVPGTGTATITARCFSSVGANAFGQTVTLDVTDTNGVEYSIAQSVANWDMNTNLDFGTMTANQILLYPNADPVDSWTGNPFNDLDQLVSSLKYLRALSPPVDIITPLDIQWPSGGQNSQYDAVHHVIPWLFSMGNNDPVLLHEIGHWSRDNTGVLHTLGTYTHHLFDTDLDPVNAFIEGWADFFAGLIQQDQGVTDPGRYLQCRSTLAASDDCAWIQNYMRYENEAIFGGGVDAAKGGGSEAAICCSMWDIIDTVNTNDGTAGDDDLVDGSITFSGGESGEAAIWAAFRDGTFSADTHQTMEKLWNIFSGQVDNGQFAGVESAIDHFGLGFNNDSAEPNNSLSTATPLALSAAWDPPLLSPPYTLYYSDPSPGAPGVGDDDYFASSAAPGQTVVAQTAYPYLGCGQNSGTDCDPNLTVYAADGTLIGQSNGGVDCAQGDRNAKVTFTIPSNIQTGSYKFFVRVNTTSSYRRTGRYRIRCMLQ